MAPTTRTRASADRLVQRPLPSPSAGPPPHEIQAVIARYAEAYAALQQVQEQSPLIPMGDQKTGAIAEFYARLYLGHRYPDARIAFGGHSESGWDLDLRRSGGMGFRIQVKGVSAFSTTRRISPIHLGWDQLYLVFLGRDFVPRGFWIVEDNAIMAAGPLRHCCSPDPLRSHGGSKKLKLGANRIAELLAAVAPQIRLAE